MRSIPSVKSWRVTYWRINPKPIVNGIKQTRVASCHVNTINKRFARWLAHDTIGYPISYALYSDDYIKVTVARTKKEIL